MNQIQIAIIVVVAVIVLVIIAYYIYQENKFKKMIENNFNQAVDDVIKQEQGLVFDNPAQEKPSAFATSQQDISQKPNLQQSEISFDPLLDSHEVPHEAPVLDKFFAKFTESAFPATAVNWELDHVVEISFDKPVKIKALPELGQYTSKILQFYVLDKDAQWLHYQRGQKYICDGLKLVTQLVDGDGVVTDLQLGNLYAELAKFAEHHHGHIRQSDSLLKLRRLQQQLKTLNHVELVLGLYLVNKDEVDYRHLAKFFDAHGFTNNNGVFEYREDGKVIFDVRDENNKTFEMMGKYRLFSITAKLHQHENPMLPVEKIFDFAESYVQYFEARLLTTNKMVLGDKDYKTLERQVASYVSNCKRNGVELGSDLIARVFP